MKLHLAFLGGRQIGTRVSLPSLSLLTIGALLLDPFLLNTQTSAHHAFFCALRPGWERCQKRKRKGVEPAQKSQVIALRLGALAGQMESRLRSVQAYKVGQMRLNSRLVFHPLVISCFPCQRALSLRTPSANPDTSVFVFGNRI